MAMQDIRIWYREDFLITEVKMKEIRSLRSFGANDVDCGATGEN